MLTELSSLREILDQVESKKRCNVCPLKEMEPLIFKPGKGVKVILVTEGPGEKWGKQMKIDADHVLSILNKTLYPYIYTLFSGRFEPKGPQANVYWTHVRKCFLDGKTKREATKALKICRKAYLRDEIESVRPKLILAVGGRAFEFFCRYDERLKGRYLDLFTKQVNDIFRNVRIGEMTFDLALVPHPSGRSRFWNWQEVSPGKAFEIFDLVIKALGMVE